MEAVVDELGYCRYLLFRASVPTELNLGWVAEVIVFQEVGQTFMNQTSDEFTDTHSLLIHIALPEWIIFLVGSSKIAHMKSPKLLHIY